MAGKIRPLALVALSLATLVAGCHRAESTASSHAAGKTRDVILITIDTWRADAAGFAGNSKIRTPFLDSLAARGIVFTNAHAHNVVTLPSHTNILTGLYPYQHGVRDNAGFVLAPAHATVATLLRNGGFATGAFVAAFPLDARFGLNQGFDVYDDNYGKGAATLDFVLQERPAPAVLDSAVKWWRSAEGRKRFLWIHLYDPHAPYHPRPPFDTDYADPYLGEVASVDEALAKQLAPLLAGSPDALVIVTGDHGEARGDHGEATHGLFAYESTLKIPLLIAGGGVAHRSEAGYVRHVDIAPTILESAGVSIPASLPGRSLLGDIGARDTYFEALSASLNRGWAPLTGVIHEGAKFIELPVSELYDLPHDPREAVNLYAGRRRDVDQARKILAAVPKAAASPRTLSAEEIARLRSLGYVAGSAAAPSSYTEKDDPKNLIGLDNKMHEIVEAFESGHNDRALSVARQVVATRPDMAAGRELLAFVLQQTGHVAEAMTQLRELVRSGKATESIRVQLALLLSETGKPADAAALLAPIASARNPDAANAYGIALADEGKLDDAAAQFEGVLALDRANAPALQNLGIVALRRGDAAGAKSYLEKALDLNPRLPLALNTLGVVYARASDFPRAVEAWNRAVAVDRRQYDALFNIGLVEAQAGHKEEARRAFEQFVSTAPADQYRVDIATARQALAMLR